MDILLHTANILYLFSYSVRDILILRVLTVVAATCLIPYFVFRPEPLWAAVGWNLLFTAINFHRIVTLLRERRPVRFSTQENTVYQQTFYSMKDRHFAKLLKIGQWKQIKKNSLLFDQGAVLDEFIVLASGAFQVQKADQLVAEIKEGEFLGETALISEAPISTKVVAQSPTLCLCWDVNRLKKLLEYEPALHADLQRVISRHLMRSLAKYSRTANLSF